MYFKCNFPQKMDFKCIFPKRCISNVILPKRCISNRFFLKGCVSNVFFKSFLKVQLSTPQLWTQDRWLCSNIPPTLLLPASHPPNMPTSHAPNNPFINLSHKITIRKIFKIFHLCECNNCLVQAAPFA